MLCVTLSGGIPANAHRHYAAAARRRHHLHRHRHHHHDHTHRRRHLYSAQSNASMPLYKDSSAPVEARVADLLSRMTLEEKIGQMTQIDRAVANETSISHRFIGSVLSGGGSEPIPHATPAQWADMVDSMQRLALSTRLAIPMLYGIDAVHGHNNVHGATIFPHNIGLGAANDPGLVQRIGEVTATEVRATGIPYAFAPCLAVCRDPRWGRCYESYGEDPDLVTGMARCAVHGLQGEPPPGYPPNQPYVNIGRAHDAWGGVIACAKHYVGDGGTVRGIDEGNTAASYQELCDIHMKPYFPAIESGVSTIMISYSSWNGVKMSANKYLITDVLKKEMGFNGFIISDWEALDRITDPPGANYRYSVQVSLNAGIDMVMVPYKYDDFIDIAISLVRSGDISESRIDDAVRRILRVKFLAGMFESPMVNGASRVNSIAGMSEDQIANCQANHQTPNPLRKDAHVWLARHAVRKSLVLLKNGDEARGSKPMLPLSKNVSKILVAGSHADDIGLQCGGWTISWQGSSGNNVTLGTTILAGIREKLNKGEKEVVYIESPTEEEVKEGGYEYAVVVVGEKPYAEYMGDNAELEIPEEGVEAIKNVCKNVKCVVVLISGRPLVVEPLLPYMDAFVAAWLPGSEAGSGIADVLFGDHGFQGRLPRTWFKRVDQLPMNIGDPHYDPLFPYGFGLSTPGPKSIIPSLTQGGLA